MITAVPSDALSRLLRLLVALANFPLPDVEVRIAWNASAFGWSRKMHTEWGRCAHVPAQFTARLTSPGEGGPHVLAVRVPALPEAARVSSW
jgi:hypothetical protein